tara:strand:- start:301 stop:1128 length:828 start_codon:yes stop_codon:yes gene_type:complete
MVNLNRNGFQAHNLKHVSVSQINKFREAPDSWLCQYLGGAKFPFGWAAIQGVAVESGVEWALFNNKPIKDAQRVAVEQMRSQAKFQKNIAENLEKREPIVERMVKVALEQLEPLGIPQKPPKGSRQHQINIPVRFADGENGTINCMGYLDFYYPEENIIVDLKTTSKAPSRWSLSHGIQASVYQKAVHVLRGSEHEINRPQVKFLYVLTRKTDPWIWLEMEDPDYYLGSFKKTITQMEKLLRLSDDKQVLIDAIPHNPDSFYWNDAQEIRQKFYG